MENVGSRDRQKEPLGEQNTGVELQKRITKRKQAGNARKENDEVLEGGQKRGGYGI